MPSFSFAPGRGGPFHWPKRPSEEVRCCGVLEGGGPALVSRECPRGGNLPAPPGGSSFGGGFWGGSRRLQPCSSFLGGGFAVGSPGVWGFVVPWGSGGCCLWGGFGVGGVGWGVGGWGGTYLWGVFLVWLRVCGAPFGPFFVSPLSFFGSSVVLCPMLGFYWFVVNILGGEGGTEKFTTHTTRRGAAPPRTLFTILRNYLGTISTTTRGRPIFRGEWEKQGALCVGCVWFRCLGGYRGGVRKSPTLVPEPTFLPIGVQPKGGK